MLLSPDERNQIGVELGDELQVVWLPGRSKPRDHSGYGFALEGAALVFLGVASGAIAQEIGKDIYGAAKKLISRIWKRQSDRTYNLQPRASLVFEHGENSVVVLLTGPLTRQGEGSLDRFEQRVEDQVSRLRENQSAIETELQRIPTSRDALTDQPQIFLLRFASNGELDVMKLSSWDDGVLGGR